MQLKLLLPRSASPGLLAVHLRLHWPGVPAPPPGAEPGFSGLNAERTARFLAIGISIHADDQRVETIVHMRQQPTDDNSKPIRQLLPIDNRNLTYLLRASIWLEQGYAGPLEGLGSRDIYIPTLGKRLQTFGAEARNEPGLNGKVHAAWGLRLQVLQCLHGSGRMLSWEALGTRS